MILKRQPTTKLLCAIGFIGLFWIFCTAGVFGFATNISDSLPNKGFFLWFGKKPKQQDYVGFYSKNLGENNDLLLIKKIVGVGGDVVVHQGRHILINGVDQGFAKHKSLKGVPLEIGFSGVIPQNKFFVMTSHPDSFDSRYKQIGLIDEKDIVAVAYPIL